MKEKFIKSSIILIIGGIITKLFSMMNKIFMARNLGSLGISLYMLIIPTYNLFINLANFGFPLAISKMISEGDKKSIKILSSTVLFTLIINILLIIIILILTPILSHSLLKEDRIYYGIVAIALVIPFTTISSIIRSYFFGKERTLPYVISSTVDDIVRFFIIIYGIPIFMKKGIKLALFYLLGSNILAEIASIIVLLLFLPKNVVITKNDLKPDKYYLKDSLAISIPTTINRLIGSITYFLEPIILTNILLLVGYKNSFIIHEYGVLQAYVLPTLLLPSFFSNAISQALLPVVSRNYKLKNYNYTKNKIKEASLICLFIGIIFTFIVIIFKNQILMFLYNTNEGINYILFLAPVLILQYILSPLSTSLDAMGKSKDNLKISIITSIIRTILLIILSLFKIGIWSLILAISINIYMGLYLVLKYLKRYLN